MVPWVLAACYSHASFWVDRNFAIFRVACKINPTIRPALPKEKRKIKTSIASCMWIGASTKYSVASNIMIKAMTDPKTHIPYKPGRGSFFSSFELGAIVRIASSRPSWCKIIFSLCRFIISD